MKNYEEFQKSSKNVKIVNFFNQTFFSFYNNYKYYQIILNNIKQKQEKSKMPYVYVEPTGKIGTMESFNNAVKIIKKLKKCKSISNHSMIGMMMNGSNDVEITITYNDGDIYPVYVIAYLNNECRELIDRATEYDHPNPSL